MISLEDFIDRYEHDIIEELKDTIDDMNIPKIYSERLKDILEDNAFDIVEYRYEQHVGDYEDMAYEQYKDERIM